MNRSWIPQGSALSPWLFVVINNGKSKLADDSKLLSAVRDENDVNNLQRDLWYIYEWSRVCQMKLNVNKCKVIHFGRKNNRDEYKYYMEDSSGKSNELCISRNKVLQFF